MTVYKPRGVDHTAASLVFDLPLKPESLQALQAHLQVSTCLAQAHSAAEASSVPHSVPHSGPCVQLESLLAGCLH